MRKTGLHTRAVIPRMRNALLKGFSPDSSIAARIQLDQQTPDLDSAVDQWLAGQLRLPDDEVGAALMPVMAERFRCYLDSFRNHS